MAPVKYSASNGNFSTYNTHNNLIHTCTSSYTCIVQVLISQYIHTYVPPHILYTNLPIHTYMYLLTYCTSIYYISQYTGTCIPPQTCIYLSPKYIHVRTCTTSYKHTHISPNTYHMYIVPPQTCTYSTDQMQGIRLM